MAAIFIYTFFFVSSVLLAAVNGEGTMMPQMMTMCGQQCMKGAAGFPSFCGAQCAQCFYKGCFLAEQGKQTPLCDKQNMLGEQCQSCAQGCAQKFFQVADATAMPTNMPQMSACAQQCKLAATPSFCAAQCVMCYMQNCFEQFNCEANAQSQKCTECTTNCAKLYYPSTFKHFSPSTAKTFGCQQFCQQAADQSACATKCAHCFAETCFKQFPQCAQSMKDQKCLSCSQDCAKKFY